MNEQIEFIHNAGMDEDGYLEETYSVVVNGQIGFKIVKPEMTAYIVQDVRSGEASENDVFCASTLHDAKLKVFSLLDGGLA